MKLPSLLLSTSSRSTKILCAANDCEAEKAPMLVVRKKSCATHTSVAGVSDAAKSPSYTTDRAVSEISDDQIERYESECE